VEAAPYVAPPPVSGEPSKITVSLGVGENQAKGLGEVFERDLLKLLAGRSVLVDKGGSAEESARVERALPRGMRSHTGSFASFASEIARSKLYIGYDSSGGHVASAGGVPAICLFAGAISDRFFERWKPLGTVIRPDGDTIARVTHAFHRSGL
jgi:ADP-heptose:LPS heptosyltransferase